MYFKRDKDSLDALSVQQMRNIPKFNQEEARRAFLIQYYRERLQRKGAYGLKRSSMNAEQLRLLWHQNGRYSSKDRF